jgi:hypothetical protein
MCDLTVLSFYEYPSDEIMYTFGARAYTRDVQPMTHGPDVAHGKLGQMPQARNMVSWYLFNFVVSINLILLSSEFIIW